MNSYSLVSASRNSVHGPTTPCILFSPFVFVCVSCLNVWGVTLLPVHVWFCISIYFLNSAWDKVAITVDDWGIRGQVEQFDKVRCRTRRVCRFKGSIEVDSRFWSSVSKVYAHRRQHGRVILPWVRIFKDTWRAFEAYLHCIYRVFLDDSISYFTI